MSVWYCIPSVRPPREAYVCVSTWLDCGYKVAVQRDDGTAEFKPWVDPRYVCVHRNYKGYAEAVNYLVRVTLSRDSECSVIVTGGDDIDPDPVRDAEELEREFLGHFGGTYGVMQPTGDRWMVDAEGRSSEERICSSPWMGREFCERINGGRGPLWPEYFHFYCDEELREVASGLGILWHNPKVTQYHHHWLREGKERPDHLNRAHDDWARAQQLFNERKAAGFPGSAPIVRDSVVTR